MRTLTLAMLWAILQASTPIPRKTASGLSRARQPVTDQTQGNEALPAQSPIINPIKANPETNAGSSAQPANAQQTVTVTKIPPVSVSRDWADWILWGFNGLLVIAGFLGIRVAYKTLKKIAEQTKATQDAAQATTDSVAAIKEQTTILRSSVDAMVASERAWVMVDVQPVPGAGPIWDEDVLRREIRDVIDGATTYSARIICKNDGKAPAWITEKHACLDIVKTLPETPDWGRTQPIQLEPEPLSVGAPGKHKDEALTCAKRREVGKMVILYGIVKYRDIFGDGRTTSFGYKVRDDGALERLPYPKYNENT